MGKVYVITCSLYIYFFFDDDDDLLTHILVENQFCGSFCHF